MSFYSEDGNHLNRRFAGNFKADPYVSGFFYVFFVAPGIAENLTYPGGEKITKSDMSNILSCTCIGVTPPSGTINKATFVGMGNVKYSVPSNIEYGDTVTLKFTEMSGLPVFKCISAWTNWMRRNILGVSLSIQDGETGKTTLKTGTESSTYSVGNYSGDIYYCTTKPDGRTIEYCAAYLDVFPQKDPHDAFGSDVSSSDKVDIDVEFNFNMMYFNESWIVETCKNKIDKAQASAGKIITRA